MKIEYEIDKGKMLEYLKAGFVDLLVRDFFQEVPVCLAREMEQEEILEIIGVTDIDNVPGVDWLTKNVYEFLPEAIISLAEKPQMINKLMKWEDSRWVVADVSSDGKSWKEIYLERDNVQVSFDLVDFSDGDYDDPDNGYYTIRVDMNHYYDNGDEMFVSAAPTRLKPGHPTALLCSLAEWVMRRIFPLVLSVSVWDNSCLLDGLTHLTFEEAINLTISEKG